MPYHVEPVHHCSSDVRDDGDLGVELAHQLGGPIGGSAVRDDDLDVGIGLLLELLNASESRFASVENREHDEHALASTR